MRVPWGRLLNSYSDAILPRFAWVARPESRLWKTRFAVYHRIAIRDAAGTPPHWYTEARYEPKRISRRGCATAMAEPGREGLAPCGGSGSPRGVQGSPLRILSIHWIDLVEDQVQGLRGRSYPSQELNLPPTKWDRVG